jgi:hypothetical protein
MGSKNDRGSSREDKRMTGADGVSVLPAAMAAALVAAGVAITRSVRKSRAAAQQLTKRASGEPGAPARTGTGPGTLAAGTGVPSGQAAVRPTVDDDGR